MPLPNTLVALLTFALVVFPCCWANVEVLTDDNFKSRTSKGRWLVKFYAPWCGHCRSMAPAFRRASFQLKGQMNFGDVDATQHTALKSEFDIGGFPTLLFFEDGEQIMTYSGGRDPESFVKFSARMSSPVVARLASTSAATDLILKDSPFRKVGENPVTVVLALPDDQPYSGAIYDKFQKVAKDLRATQVFGATNSATVTSFLFNMGKGMELENPTLEQPLLIKLEVNEKPKIFPITLDDAEEKMEQWIRDNLVATFSLVDAYNFGIIASADKPTVLACINPKDKSPKTQDFLEEVKMAARRGSHQEDAAWYGKFQFGYMDAAQYADFFSQYNIQRESLPRLLVLNLKNKMFYEDREKDSLNNVGNFLVQVIEGDIPAQMDTQIYRAIRMFMQGLPYSALLLAGGLLLFGVFVKFVILAEDEEDQEGDDDGKPKKD